MCGVSINQSKTKSATRENLVGEFVSRSINNGADVSRISANICRAVRKNILDIPQLASHLHERNYESMIPLKGIFDQLRLKEGHVLNLIRTFYVLCRLYPRQGLNLLENSLKDNYPDIIWGDEIISTITSHDISYIKDSYNLYLVSQLLISITDKAGRIFDSTTEFDSSEMLAQKAEPDK
jgi:hypothetical protein